MNKKKTISALIVFTIIFASHFVMFLAFYPGICTYDLNTQIGQYTSHDYLTNHPLIHTLFVGYFHNLFADAAHEYNINLGYAYATIIQLVIVDSAMTYSVLYLKEKCNKTYPCILATLFYAIFPTNSLLAISHTKDVLFSSFALIFFIDSMRFIENDRKKSNPIFLVRMTLNISLSLLLRNNAIHAMLACIIIICIICFVSHKKKIANKSSNLVAILALAFILAFVSNKALVLGTKAGPSSIKEMMSIPAQIMGRVYNSVATEEEKSIISSYIPNTDDYNFYLADPMKRYLPFEIWESKCKHFLLDSTIIAIKHPFVSIQAIWYNVQGYFDPFHQPYSSDHFFLARHDYSGDATQETRIPSLCNLYVDHFRVTNPSNPFTVFLNLAIYIWIFVIAFIILLRKPGQKWLAYLFGVFYLFTLMLGPGAIVRYGFYFILCSPIALHAIISKK